MSKGVSGWRGLVLGALALASCLGAPEQDEAAPAFTRRIALSFDDGPLPDGPFLTADDRAERMVAAFRRTGVGEVAIFSTPRTDTPRLRAHLAIFSDAGHAIANHSLTHPNLRELTAEDYLANVAAADRILRPLPGFKAWFRFPYLSEGDTEEKRDAVRAGLIAMGYAQGYVTADSYDWFLDTLARRARSENRELDMDALRALYVRTAVEGADYADRMARATLGRTPVQMMLLHENDLAGLFIEDLIAGLRADGWTIVPASQAFADPIANEYPNTLQLGGGRIYALAEANGRLGRFAATREGFAALEAPFMRDVVRH